MNKFLSSRPISIVLVLALAFALVGSVAAPGGFAQAATPKHLTLWYGYNRGGAEEAVLQYLLRQYRLAHPGITITATRVPFGELFTDYEAAVAGGGGPDLYTAPNDNLGNEARAGVIAPLDVYLADKLDNYNRMAIAGMKVDGHIYGVPGIAKAVALYYTQSTVPVPPATTSDLLEMVKAGKKLLVNQNVYHNFGFWHAFGGTLMDANGRCIADQGGFAEAFQYLKDLKDAGALFETDPGVSDSLFMDGQADMLLEGPWVLGDFWSELGDTFRVSRMPSGPVVAATPITGIDGWYVNPNSPNKAAAVNLGLDIFDKAGQTAYANFAGDPPTRTDVTINDPWVKAFMNAAALGYPRPQNVEFNNYWGPFGDALNSVLDGNVAPADAVSTACAAMNAANGK